MVEGRYDAHAVRQAVNAPVLETSGFHIFRDTELRTLLRRLGAERGVIVLTDSDGAGFLIRSHIKGLLPPEQLKHAYIPDIRGKERRKSAASKEGLLGVEGMDADTIRQALVRAGASVTDADMSEPLEPVTKADFYEWGLTGTPDASARRERLLAALGFPRRMSVNALLCAINALYSREEASKAVENALR